MGNPDLAEYIHGCQGTTHDQKPRYHVDSAGLLVLWFLALLGENFLLQRQGSGCKCCFTFLDVFFQTPTDAWAYVEYGFAWFLFPDLEKGKLGGGFKHFFFSPLPGEMIQFD